MGKDSWSGYTNSFSKPFMEILFSYLPFKFLVRFLFPQLLTDPSAAEYQLPLIVFDKGPEARVFLKIKFWAPLRSSDKNGTGLFQGAGRQVKQGQCFGNGLFFFFFFWGAPNKPCPPSGCKAAAFQGYCRPEQREMGAVQAAMPQTLLSETQQFFLSKYSSDCWKPLANFKSSEIADFGHLCQCFHCF